MSETVTYPGITVLAVIFLLNIRQSEFPEENKINHKRKLKCIVKMEWNGLDSW